MPELPEVETVRRGLERALAGLTIIDVRVLVAKMLKGRVHDPEEFRRQVTGRTIISVQRRGKYLIFEVDSRYYLLFHLKMRGHMRVVRRDEPDGKYLALGLTVAASNGEAIEMRFHDIWTWGEVRYLSDNELNSHSSLTTMGVEPLSDAFTREALHQSLSRRSRTAVKTALLDQTVVAGVGNIYADESLFRSGIGPLRLSGMLSIDEAGRLRDAIRLVLAEAVDGGGTASDEFIDTNGNPGRYRPLVYDRGGEPCPRCGDLLRRTRVGGRGTVFCSVCQA
ncbi:MAG: bifunctional DNA-formamidopyrimidine glycosylase/DNA-(apurinic or apyrimidinic site) lyase [Capsulimonadaceae bacterium]